MTRILIVGNHTCGNRGDCAILRGLLECLEDAIPGSRIDVTSRFPVSSEYLLGRSLLPDTLNRYYVDAGRKRLGALRSTLLRRLVPRLLHGHLRRRWWAAWVPLPRLHREYIASLAAYDVVIQVGGSFFVDLYGATQYDQASCALLAGRPVYMIGHSVGPFQHAFFRKVSQDVMARVDALALREEVSARHMRDAAIPQDRLRWTSDTAWLVHPGVPVEVDTARPTVAVTFRELAPFDKRLGVTQAQYEGAFAELLDAVIDAGFHVRAFSTCTAIDGYPKDDRMIALKVRSRLRRPESFEVEMDELNDVQLGRRLGACVLTIGTRLHSAIISMNFGTPSVALNYEHKSEGIMKRLGVDDLAMPVHSLLDGTLRDKVLALLADSGLRARVAAAVAREKTFARESLLATLAIGP
ncbi:colanic acid biosynthesis pyruvyl transferase WcaK [Luteibacter yeojuensis]|uniref:Colanic acid biosynthesis pyruvyl transferase WcaK n=1 Tax=Luteibacter yeojuensis TaxID=345309 RepID=A0A7X5TNI9_9GAMM|nr:colanic acid biosynthesis pyruvyl transferase WcaK [Luteibacter yeojuensis]NID14581.1 colanic acid biosynthesis pyruvyl transferase WcaK [Luteibacter yeojuensis]